MARVFAGCSENQSDGTRVRGVFGEPIKTPETRFALGLPAFVSRPNENRSLFMNFLQCNKQLAQN